MRMIQRIAVMVVIVFGILMPCAGATAEDAPAPDDLLTLAKGAVLVSAAADPLRALALTDGDPESNWNASTKKVPLPHVFVFELIAPATITEAGIIGAGDRPGGVAGGSAGNVLIEGSAEGPDAGFATLATLDAAPNGETLAPSAISTPVRWLRYTINGAQSADASWLYFNEAVAHGTTAPPSDPDRFTGVFQSGRVDFIELKQDGAALTGCYIENSGRSTGTLSGSVNEGVALLNWTSEQGIQGNAFMTIDSTGALAGVRYRQRSRNAWGGPPAPEGTTTPCSDIQPVNPIVAALQEAGEVQIYGILFNHDSDVPKASSRAALEQLREALASDTSLDVTIEGHTDSDGDDAYNLDLSQRRAASVVSWLTDAGIEATRMQPAGRGESEPVASNNTADGKALNRRVEVVRR
jgi:outer membrane protein OmpA-like peptidoglycan-associated protein